ncbi:hypothetical protein [Wolbachia endosymbiont of Ctenocephalides felis wCfeT]|uniref:hypothetical protein n=1 Tax=Wolbachia endosymbiont of Ctenocephalides felis wCfeT TaxID=2732593 RepID=UPI001445C53A|nr:hypothetical protein [Wolbachia endosymbiont of Ctenocephalides felis wCfeT]
MHTNDTNVFSENLNHNMSGISKTVSYIPKMLRGIKKYTFVGYLFTERIKEAELDREIRGGKKNGRGEEEVSQIDGTAVKIEIIPDFSPLGYKKGKFIIAIPISKKQKEVLDDQRKENAIRIMLGMFVLTATGVVLVLVIGQSFNLPVLGAVLASIILLAGVARAIQLLKSNTIDNDLDSVRLCCIALWIGGNA